MRKTLLFLTLTFFTSFTFSQNSFDKAYFVNNAGERIECFIKNKDWLYNPDEFEYKVSLDVEKKVENIKRVKEFGIYNKLKYVRFTVEIDRSSDNITTLSKERRPIFNKETLFLKMLIEGKANLYSYTDNKGGLKRFFYNVND